MHIPEFSENPRLFPVRNFGVVKDTISPPHRGRIYFQATFWPACLATTDSASSLLPDSLVEVIGRVGLTLIVQPLHNEENKSL